MVFFAFFFFFIGHDLMSIVVGVLGFVALLLKVIVSFEFVFYLLLTMEQLVEMRCNFHFSV